MKLWHNHYTIAEMHQYVEDLHQLQNQRTASLLVDSPEEAKRYDSIIEMAQLCLERILENLGPT